MSPPLRTALGWLLAPAIVIAVLASLLFYAPFIVVVATSWTAGNFIAFPPTGFSLQWYERVLTHPGWQDAFGLSLGVSVVATVIAVAVGTAGALALSRLRTRRARRWLRTLFIVPIAIPPVSYGVGLFIINQNVPVLTSSLAMLVLGQAVLAVPYVFLLVSGGVEHADPALRPAAATMGASWRLILWRVELGALVPHIMTSVLFAFVLVFDEVVLAVFLVPVGEKTFPLQLFTAAQEAFSPELTAASTLVSVVALVLIAGFRVVSNRVESQRSLRKVKSP